MAVLCTRYEAHRVEHHRLDASALLFLGGGGPRFSWEGSSIIEWTLLTCIKCLGLLEKGGTAVAIVDDTETSIHIHITYYVGRVLLGLLCSLLDARQMNSLLLGPNHIMTMSRARHMTWSRGCPYIFSSCR